MFPMIDHRKRFEIHLSDHRKQFGVPMIDHRKRFDGEMIALMNDKPVYFSDDRSTEISAGQKSDHLPVKPFPMIDHLPAKLIQMIAHLPVKTFPMIDHRQQFGGEMIALLTGTFFR